MSRYGLLACWAGVLVLLAGCASAPRDTVDEQAAARANAALGMTMLGNGQYTAAREKFERALAYDSDNRRALWGMALVFQRLGQADRARFLYERIIGPRAVPALLNSYATFACQQGQVDQALRYFRQAADDERNHAPAVALSNAGLCLDQAGNNDAAQAYYRRALHLDAKQFMALAQMAQIQYEKGKYLSARAFIERADASHDELNAELLLVAARIELALGEREAARQYLVRHNKRRPAATMKIDQLSHAG